MMRDLEMPSGETWRLITRSSKRFATDNPRQLHDGSFPDVLRWSKQQANRHGAPVRIAAWWQGEWHWVDTAYPDDYAD